MTTVAKVASPNATPQAKGSLSLPYNGTFAFLVHSQDTLNNNLPPSIDNRPLARQKRRRTSPGDHAILEEEYQLNPKPDKAARIAIVGRVALGEKEVQIWFQNRRQIARRRSRPLPPNGITLDSFSSQETFGNATSSDMFSNGGTQRPVSSSQSSIYSSISIEDATQLQGSSEATTQSDILDDVPKQGKPETKALDSHVNGCPHICSQKDNENHYTVQSPVASASIHNPETECGLVSTVTSLSTSGLKAVEPAQDRQMKRTSSLIRLSMSLDGKAEVKTEVTPSPPRSQPLPLNYQSAPQRMTLQRSHSAVAPYGRSSLEGESIPSFPRRFRQGRSGDARTWEFYCDPEAQDALTAQAEREQSGSAISAIGLIRSQSSNVMMPTNNKRNAQVPKHESMKRLKGNCEQRNKPKLARTTSSVARLETARRYDVLVSSKQKQATSCSQPNVIVLPSGDSDKENWEPGTQTYITRRPRNPKSQKRRPVLEENSLISVQSTHSDASTIKSRARSFGIADDADDKENMIPDEDEEVAGLVDTASLPRKTEDLDCIQGLLSLRQGAWR